MMSGSAPCFALHHTASTPAHNKDSSSVLKQEPHHWNLTVGEEASDVQSAAQQISNNTKVFAYEWRD